jgi:hypothetical protein
MRVVHTYINADSYCCVYTNAVTDSNRDSYVNTSCHSDTYGDAHCDRDPKSYSDANCDAYAGGRDLEFNRQPHRRTLWIHGDIVV